MVRSDIGTGIMVPELPEPRTILCSECRQKYEIGNTVTVKDVVCKKCGKINKTVLKIFKDRIDSGSCSKKQRRIFKKMVNKNIGDD